MCEVEVGDEPRTLAVSLNGHTVYVTTQRSQTLAIIDLGKGQRTATIELVGQPLGVVLSADGRRAFVSEFAGDYIDGIYSPGTIAVVDLVETISHQEDTCQALSVRASSRRQAPESLRNPLFRTQ